MFKSIINFIRTKIAVLMEDRLSDYDRLVALKEKMLNQFQHISRQRVEIDAALRKLNDHLSVSARQEVDHVNRYKVEKNDAVKQMIAKTILLLKKKQVSIEEQKIKLVESRKVITDNVDDLRARIEGVVSQISYVKEIKALGGSLADMPDLAAGLEHLNVDIDMTELQMSGDIASGATTSEIEALMAELDKK